MMAQHPFRGVEAKVARFCFLPMPLGAAKATWADYTIDRCLDRDAEQVNLWFSPFCTFSASPRCRERKQKAVDGTPNAVAKIDAALKVAQKNSA
jgi:hypothetical protein